MELEEDPGIPRFNFDPASLVPGITMAAPSHPRSMPSSSKLNARPTTSLQVLSPRARAVNALGSPKLQPQQPALPSSNKHKGKGRARPVEIIELTDSDSDEIPVASTSRFAAGPSRSIPSTIASGNNEPHRHTPALRTDNPVTAAIIPQREPTLASRLPTIAALGPGPATLEDGSGAGSSKTNPLDQLLASVIEIVPDVDPDHVMSLYTSKCGTVEGATGPTGLLEAIVFTLLENANYPKKKTELKRKRREEPETSTAGPSTSKKRKVVMKMNVATKDRPRIYSLSYYNLCVNWLGIKFPYLRKPFITKTLSKHHNFYAPTFVYLKTLQNAGAIPASHMKKSRTKAVYTEPIENNVEFQREFQWCADWQPGKSGEIEYTVEPGADSGPNPNPDEEPSTQEDNQEENIESEECEEGEGMECGTCCSTYTVNTMIQCPDGHLFCKGCVFRLSKERLGQRSTKIKCMDSQTDCQLEFMVAQLELCLPPKLLDLYHRIKQAEEISAAGLENLEECPFCEYKCVIDNENERLFRCQNEDCSVVSCRNCKKKDHLPKTCAEMEEDTTLNAQHLIEEAMTNALMRKCPKCQATFVKSDGCNKIKCAKCGQLSCYICRKAIAGYDHFNQAPPGARPGPSSSQAKCALWDGPNGSGGAETGLAQRHHDEVAKAREEALAKLKQSNPEVDISRVKVDAPVVPTPLVQQQQRFPLPPMVYPPMPAMPPMPILPVYPPAVPGQPAAALLDAARLQQEYYNRLARGAPQPPPQLQQARVVAPRRCTCNDCLRR